MISISFVTLHIYFNLCFVEIDGLFQELGLPVVIYFADDTFVQRDYTRNERSTGGERS